MKILKGTDGLSECVRALRAGGIVAYPTETFYGFGVDAMNEAALHRLGRLKGRPESSPFPLLVPDLESLKALADSIPEKAHSWISKFWPGPLTIILSSSKLPSILKGPTGGTGFRISSNPLAMALVTSFGSCITTTSANRSGQPPARSVDDLAKCFSSEDLSVLDGGMTEGGEPSTVVDLTNPKLPTVVRPGKISTMELGL